MIPDESTEPCSKGPCWAMDGHDGPCMPDGTVEIRAVFDPRPAAWSVPDDEAEPSPAALLVEVANAIQNGDAVVCLTRCWACQFGEHFAPPQWHTWADADDVDHAKATGQPDPSGQRCGCDCAKAEKEPTDG